MAGWFGQGAKTERTTPAQSTGEVEPLRPYSLLLPFTGDLTRNSRIARTGEPRPTARAATVGHTGRPGGKRGADARGIKPILAVVTVIIGLAAVGYYLAIGTFTQSASGWNAGASQSPAFVVDQQIPTAFGSMVVTNVEQIDGLTDDQLDGMSHDIQDLVAPDQVQITVSVTLTNRLGYPVPIAPEQFALLTSTSDQPVDAAWSSSIAGSLQPGSSLDTTLHFVTKRDGARLWLGFLDGEHTPPLRVSVGQTDQAPPGTQSSDEHHHP